MYLGVLLLVPDVSLRWYSARPHLDETLHSANSFQCSRDLDALDAFGSSEAIVQLVWMDKLQVSTGSEID